VEESLAELESDTNGGVPIIAGTGLDAVQGLPVKLCGGIETKQRLPIEAPGMSYLRNRAWMRAISSLTVTGLLR
jgi:hypothetical protein